MYLHCTIIASENGPSIQRHQSCAHTDLNTDTSIAKKLENTICNFSCKTSNNQEYLGSSAIHYN